MSIVSSIRNNWTDPSFWTERALPHAVRRTRTAAVNKPLNTVYDGLVRYRHGGYYDVMDEEWDNLIILDACRYDVLRERRETLPGTLELRYSCGGSTGGFLRNQFEDSTFPDTVYVSANPHVARIVPDSFFDRVPAWQTDWDDDMNTVLPADMRNRTLRVADQYPHKRLITHFAQPHQPYVSEWAKRELELPHGLEGARRLATGEFDSPSEIDREELTTYLHLFADGAIDRQTIWTAYQKNVDAVLSEVEQLVADLDGRTVITADHGEMFKERTFPYYTRFVGHRGGVRSPHLNRVPWVVIDGDRRKIHAGEQTQHGSMASEEQISDRLVSLGYIDE